MTTAPQQSLTNAQNSLRDAQSRAEAAIAAHNVLATTIRGHQATLDNVRAQMTTQHVIASRQLMEQARQQAADEQAFLNQNRAALAQLRATAERARVEVSYWQNQVQMAQTQLQQANVSAARTDNRTPQPTPITPVDTPVVLTTLQPESTAGTNGQAPPDSFSEELLAAAGLPPTAPTSTGGTLTTPVQDQPKAGATQRESSTSLLAPPPALQPEEIIPPRADHRVRLSAFDRNNAQAKIDLYGPDDAFNILKPLHATDGVLFPYTPNIQINQDTTWQTADLEHSNFDILSFQKSSSASISLTADFTVQTQREGRYLLAVIHFLRTVSKAYFGAQSVEHFDPPTTQAGSTATPQENAATTTERQRQDGKAGLPPPVLLFSGYGDLMFNDIRVVVKSHSWSYEKTADLIKITLPSPPDSPARSVWLPPMMTITMALAMQNNTDRMRDRFNLDEFRTGNLLKNRGWF